MPKARETASGSTRFAALRSECLQKSSFNELSEHSIGLICLISPISFIECSGPKTRFTTSGPVGELNCTQTRYGSFVIRYGAVALALFGLLALSWTDAPKIAGTRVLVPPVIDGHIDENTEWKDVPSFEGLLDPNTHQPAPELAKFWLASDAKFVYFAARVADTEPKSIRAEEYRINASVSGDDYIDLELNPSGTLSDFNSFRINPRGATEIQLAGGRAAKREWAGEIVVVGRVTATGWEVEAKIPWQIMRLPRPGQRDLRFQVNRRLQRLHRLFSYAYTSDGRDQDTPNLGQGEFAQTIP